MPPKKNSNIPVQNEHSEQDGRRYNLRKNKKDKQMSKSSDRSKKGSNITYSETFDLPEGVYDEHINISSIDKSKFKKNIIEVHTPNKSASPNASPNASPQKSIFMESKEDSKGDNGNISDETDGTEEEEFDDSYFESRVYKSPPKKK